MRISDWSSDVCSSDLPKVLIDDLRRETERREASAAQTQAGNMADLFADFNGLPDDNAKTEFYQHDAHWANRMILGDSLQVMAPLAEREGPIGRASCRARVCQYEEISVVAVYLKKKNTKKKRQRQ